jgi:hippurate hydrolase
MPTTHASDVRSLIKQELEALVALRRDLHENPELHFEEKRTSQVVQRELAALGIPFRAGLARGTGVVAHLASTDPANASRPAIALRADMDALPIVEKTGRAYSSRNPGVMHACGHDGHTAILHRRCAGAEPSWSRAAIPSRLSSSPRKRAAAAET